MSLLIIKIEEYKKYVGIFGFKNVNVSDIEGFISKIREISNGIQIQVFDANFIAGWEHLYFAVLNALKAFEGKYNISENIEIEIILFAAFQHQIRKALEILGVKRKSSNLAIVILADSEENIQDALKFILKIVNGVLDENVVEVDENKLQNLMDTFSISELELSTKTSQKNLWISAVKDLIIERIAISATQR